MKFLLLNRVTYPLCLIVMLGFMLILARPAQPLDSMIAFFFRPTIGVPS